jgi:predicted RNase H-like HicB family nuclease
MVIYEHCKRNYGGFAPDIPGAGSVGKDLPEMRRMMKECLEFHLESMAADGDRLPKPTSTSFDFGEIRDKTVDHYVVEWLEIKVPKERLTRMQSGSKRRAH